MSQINSTNYDFNEVNFESSFEDIAEEPSDNTNGHNGYEGINGHNGINGTNGHNGHNAEDAAVNQLEYDLPTQFTTKWIDGYEFVDFDSDLETGFESLFERQNLDQLVPQPILDTCEMDFIYEAQLDPINGTSAEEEGLDQLDQAKLIEFKTVDAALSVAFNINGTYFAFGSADKTIHIHKTENVTDRPHKVLKGHTDSANCVKWDPRNNHRLASASDDGTVRLWDLSTNTSITIHTECKNQSLAWSPDGYYIAVTTDTEKVKIIDVDNWVLERNEYSSSNQINSVTFNSEGNFILCGTFVGSVVVIRFDNRKDECTLSHAYNLPAHSASCISVDIDVTGSYLATAGLDGRISVWCLNTMVCLTSFGFTGTAAKAAKFSADGRLLACGYNSGQIEMFDIYENSLVYTYDTKGPVNALDFHPNSYKIVAIGANLVQVPNPEDIEGPPTYKSYPKFTTIGI